MSIALGYIFSLLYGGFCIALGILCHKLGMPKKYSRKVVHITVGFEWVILAHFFGATVHFLIVCLAFLFVNIVVYMKNLLPMMSSEGENAPGTIYYAVSMSVMALISMFIPEMLFPFGIGVFCTSFGDGFAGVVGQLIKKFNPKIYANKSLFGMLANFVFSFIVALVFAKVFSMPLSMLQCAAVAVLSVGLETVTGKGFDNVTVTVGTSLLAYAFIYFDEITFFIVPILVTPAIIGAVLKKKVLTPMGLAFAMFLDLVVTLTLGNSGFIILLAFLVFSVLIDKVKKHKKEDDGITKRGECRDHIQVLANGLIPMMMAILFSTTYKYAFAVGYVAALAEAFADTAASGLGVLSKNTYDIFKLKKCQKGISGGMSVIGTVSALCGAFLIGALALLIGALDARGFLIVSLSAFLGTVFDSLLGSLLQIKYRCTVCSSLTEREVHCEKPTEKISGISFFDNDVVNLFSGAFSAILAAVLFSVLA